MFIENKYTKWYFQLIESRKQLNRKKEKGLQSHHIIPRCFDGSNDDSNIAILTPREHYICHLLLVEMTSGKNRSKMVFAFFRFNSKDKKYTNSRSYDFFMKDFGRYITGENNPFYGKHLSKEHKEKISGKNHGMFGKGCYDIWLEKYGKEEADIRKKAMLEKRSISLSGKNNPQYGKTQTKERRKKHSDLMKIKMNGENNPNFGKIWINNSIERKLIQPMELSKHINEGWVKGRGKF